MSIAQWTANHDIILLTETWTFELSDLHVEGFDHFVLNITEMKKSCKRCSGCVIVYLCGRNSQPNDILKTYAFNKNNLVQCIGEVRSC